MTTKIIKEHNINKYFIYLSFYVGGIMGHLMNDWGFLFIWPVVWLFLELIKKNIINIIKND
jgi:hypothetical protein